MDKVVIWNGIQQFAIIYSFSIISFYKSCLNQRNRRKDYPLFPSIFDLAILLLFAAFIFYLTKIAYDRFSLISNNGLLFIPVAIIPLAAIVYFVMWFLQRNITRSIDIYFILPNKMVELIQKVLPEMGWKDIQVSQTAPGQTTFSDPDKKYIVQARSDQLKDTFIIQPIDKKLKVITLTDNFKKLLLREQAKSTYPIDSEMVLLFKKKYLWLYILSWFSLCLCIYLLLFH